MLPLGLPKKNDLKILCLGAHCDDIEIGCGGTILRLLQENPSATVMWTVFSGSSVRNAEFHASARKFLGDAALASCAHQFPDGYLPHAWKDVKDTFEEIKSAVDPDVIFTHFRHDLHQDHRVVSELTWNTFRNHLIFEYEIPKFDGDLGSPNWFSLLSDDVCRKKIRLILESYPSQASKGWFTEDTFSALLRLRGVESGSPTRFAEAFYARKLTY